MLNIITNPSLRNIDGLSGLLSVTLVRTFMNTALCYVGTSEPSEVYWEVCLVNLFICITQLKSTLFYTEPWSIYTR